MQSSMASTSVRAMAPANRGLRTVRAGLHRQPRLAVTCSLPSEYKEKLQGFKVLVAGATGQTGRQIVQLLRDEGVSVRALVRDVDKAEKMFLKGPDLEIVQGNVFQFASLPAAMGDANAVIVATGASDRFDPLGPFNVDYEGTNNLVALAKQKKAKKFILVTSIGTDELFNVLNLFWGVLFWKKRAEEALQRSGLEYTIVRPGGLKNTTKDGELPGSIVMEGPGFFGVPPARPPAVPSGSILRQQVAEVCIAALVEPDAVNKVVEIVAVQDAPLKTFAELFKSVM